jgi:hypothetical protein
MGGGHPRRELELDEARKGQHPQSSSLLGGVIRTGKSDRLGRADAPEQAIDVDLRPVGTAQGHTSMTHGRARRARFG